MALVASLALGLSVTACNPSFTLGYIYTMNTKGTEGSISAYTIDSVSGALTQTANSPFDSGGQYPVANAVDNKSKHLYVVHEVDNTVVLFNIGTDGKLYRKATVNTPGTYPIAVTIDSTSNFLFVVDSYAPGFNGVAPPNINPLTSNTTPTQGCVVVYKISQSDGTLSNVAPLGGSGCFPIGTATVGAQPIGITATAFVHYVYVADQGTHSIYAYSVDYTSGQLTPLANNNVPAGVRPSAIVSEPRGRFVYVTDQYQNVILGYSVLNDGSLLAQPNGPFATDVLPSGMAIDPRGKFLYVTSYSSSTVRAYAINPANGNPGAITGKSVTGTNPTCIAIEPAYGRYVYTADFRGNTVSGFKLDPATGALTTVLNSPFTAGGQPTCIAAAANGTHPIQNITP